ncbi:MAG: M20/M25/M40 family metallo-hydrolase [Mesorhizobium sp.]|uniref:M20/M25/M40 family metallo-hydrolase n=2 Tax=Mesorhizobium TaxID=68287 RepID=UPI000FE99249|nr:MULTISPECIES: M20/M25/M40 family metallo-hydrolase [unclassified Mesorhizobium]MCT2581102.1 M20/M25/M40 family metallo-hydrolase [Mesorhizobium sp. P13.3]MDF3170138.1 M20/M25/M40 family metallo-hydrolase [Mesorhizobium sp. P16.1]MDF3181084.1 M20/M25/M40 family metallo-hydrolase [Mesorhizobium sp. P17.1]MDF3187015.1 M20/M25/M40 family metallo-hydrolase [Mesorhizobium sp. ICCV3110.1]RWG23176.1 MAG: M20/M25/M40 family metallo-hydrolase [Mesorhizobium sp.]
MSAIDKWNPTKRVREISIRLVEWASETGTPGEAEFAEKLAGLLREIPYFRDHPDHVRLVDSHGSPMTKSVVAVVRRRGSRTLAMAGHYDVVSVANYRDLAPLAFKPDELLAALMADLESRSLNAAEQRARLDFRTGDFLPGRGLLDMKSGIAAGVAVLEAFAENPDRRGNLVLVATPDEERGSRGMRSLRDALPAIATEFGLNIAAGINLDATSDQGDGAEGRAIYRGTIGKALPFALVIGRSSHAGYPFEGISAQLIAAEVTKRIEGNPALCDRSDGEISPPPICLECKDLRGGYEVTTPERVWIAFNWLSHAWGPHDLLRLFTQAIVKAMENAISRFNEHAQTYAKMLATPQSAPVADGEVITISELRERIQRNGGDAALTRIAALEAEMQDCDDPLRLTRTIVSAMVTEADIIGPTIVVGFSSLLYPSTHLDTSRDHQAFAAAIEAARLAFEAAGGSPVKYREYFTGISDMSFFGHRPDEADVSFVAANTPASALVDKVRQNVLSFPVVNVGPWGREYHQRLERVHTPYSFDELPRLLREIVSRLLA